LHPLVDRQPIHSGVVQAG